MLSAGTALRSRAGLPRARGHGGTHVAAGPVVCRAARHLAALRSCSPSSLHTVDARQPPQRQVYGSRGARSGRASPALIEHNRAPDPQVPGRHGVQQGYTLQSLPPGSANETLMVGPGPVRVEAMSLNNVVPVAQGFVFQKDTVPYYSLPVQSMPVDYGNHGHFIDHMGQRFNEVVTVESVPAWEYHNEPPPPPPVSDSPEPEMSIQRSKTKVQRTAPPPPRSPSPSSEEEPVLRAKKNKVQRAAGPPAPAPPPPPQITYVDHEEPKYRTVAVEKDVLVPKHETVNVETIKVNERIVNVDRVKVAEELVDVEKIVVKEVHVPFDVYVDNIVVKEVVQEVEIERLVIKEVEVPIDRVVVKEVQVPVERIVENVVTQEVPVERIVVKEVPVKIERVVVQDVQVPVERIVERIVERPVERIVHQERIVYQDRIVHQDRVIEVPVERIIEVPPPVVPVKKIGLGVLLHRNTQFKGMTYIEDIVPGFAAANSGQVRVGDFVTAIDGQPVEGWELDNIKQLTIGDEGTMCTLTIKRGSDTFNVHMIRVSPAVVGSAGQKAINSYGL